MPLHSGNNCRIQALQHRLGDRVCEPWSDCLVAGMVLHLGDGRGPTCVPIPQGTLGKENLLGWLGLLCWVGGAARALFLPQVPAVSQRRSSQCHLSVTHEGSVLRQKG